MTMKLAEKVLLLGSSGLLGSRLTPVLIGLDYRIETHGRGDDSQHQVMFDNPVAARQLLDSVSPDVIVNLVGLTNVDQCELYPNQAYLANVRTVENVVGWIKQQKTACHLIHVSTDQVYDGAGPHLEEQVALTNCYAFSKYAGELAAAQVPSTILRTNFFGRSRCTKRASFTDWLQQAQIKEEAIKVFEDVLFNPLSMASLSELIALVIDKKPRGVFNLGANGGMSKADFAFEFAARLGLSTSAISRTTVKQLTTLKAYRPKDMRMDCLRFETVMGIQLPKLHDEIIRVAKEYV